MEMDQHLFDECTTAYRAERMKEKQVCYHKWTWDYGAGHDGKQRQS